MTASKQGILNRILGRTGVTTKLDYLQADSVLSPDVSADNYLINGGFDFNQRWVNSAQTVSGYSLDRWYAEITGTCSVYRISTSPPLSSVQYLLKWVTGSSSSAAFIQQAIEQKNVIPLRSKIVTLSGWIKNAGTAYSNSCFLRIWYSNSTDARASIITEIASLTISPATIWTKYSVSCIVPSDAIGLRVGLVNNISQASGVEIHMSNFMLNIGSIAAPFVRAGKTIGHELALCQRYFEKLSYSIEEILGANPDIYLIGCALNTAKAFFTERYKVTKRIEPSTIYYFDKVGAVGGSINAGGWNNGKTATTEKSDVDAITFSYDITGLGFSIYQCVIGNGAIAVDSEL